MYRSAVANRNHFLAACCILLCLASMGWGIQEESSLPNASATDAQRHFFESRIRPILIDHCYECHSVETERNGGLLLDSREGWQFGGDTGPALVPGNPDESLVMRAIGYNDPRIKMPPDGKLPPQAIEDLRKWIAEGALDPRNATKPAPKKAAPLSLEDATRHWAYRPLMVPLREVANGSDDGDGSTRHSASTIDRFIDRKLSESGIEAAPRASKIALLRRLKFDLHGLPPTTEEIQEFESDSSPDAYERWVDRWMASPRFGERMARHWLDVARYAESYTLRGFVMPEAWRYRDYCIQAFSGDLPWDQFLREQVAGDLMSSADLEVRRRQQIAVTFLLLGNNNLEEQDKEQLDMDVIDEQLETLGKAFLGQTIGCARCHDHKFDPIPTRDYYALAGIFKSSTVLKHENVSKWVEVPLAVDSDAEKKFRELESERNRLQSEMKKLEKLMKGDATPSPKSVAISSLAGIVVDDSECKRVGEWKESETSQTFVGANYLHDEAKMQGKKTVTFEPKSIPPGTYEVRISHTPGKNRATNAMIRVFSADGDSMQRVNQRDVPPIDGLWTSLGRYRFEKDGQAYVLVSNEDADGHVIADAVQFLPIELAPNSVANADSKTGATDKAAQQKSSSDSNDKERIASMEKRIQEMKAATQKLNDALELRPMAMGLQAVKESKDIPIHIRGSVHSLGEVVPRGFLQLTQAAMKDAPGSGLAKTTPQTARPSRLELAEWLSDPRHPLTARVASNRVWYWMMGEGLVDTLDNFGTTGNPPSHPELLDSLASRLIDSRWSVKQLVRDIVCSEAYRRSSDRKLAKGISKDPENRLYAVAHRKRLDAESIRDALLQVSGQLVLDAGGKKFAKGLQNDFGYSHPEPCRSVYLPIFRKSVPDLLTTFDMADTSVGIGKRSRTTVAQQALVMLNHPMVVEHSRRAAAKWMKRNLEPRELLEDLALEIWGRPLREGEDRVLQAFLFSKESASSDAGSLTKKSFEEARLATLIQSMIASLDFRFLE